MQLPPVSHNPLITIIQQKPSPKKGLKKPFSHLSGKSPAGIGTTALLPVAGRHRASPSTSLDKSFVFIKLF
jgi:hypothetical protein